MFRKLTTVTAVILAAAVFVPEVWAGKLLEECGCGKFQERTWKSTVYKIEPEQKRELLKDEMLKKFGEAVERENFSRKNLIELNVVEDMVFYYRLMARLYKISDDFKYEYEYNKLKFYFYNMLRQFLEAHGLYDSGAVVSRLCVIEACKETLKRMNNMKIISENSKYSKEFELDKKRIEDVLECCTQNKYIENFD